MRGQGAGGNEGIPLGSTAIFEVLTRTLEMDHAAMAASFRTVLADIRSGGFARRSRTRNGTAIRCWRVSWSGDGARLVYWYMYAPAELQSDLEASGFEIVESHPRGYMMTFVGLKRR